MVRLLADKSDANRSYVTALRRATIEIVTIQEFHFRMEMILSERFYVGFQEVTRNWLPDFPVKALRRRCYAISVVGSDRLWRPNS
jgi:hypothetical protein